MPDVDWWDRIGQASWQHVVLAVAALMAFVALSLVPMKCSFSMTTPTTTTTSAAR